MITFLKYLRGYVRIKVWGFSPERFINLCGNKGILLWEIEKDEDVYFMYISLRHFYELQTILKKTGTRVVILQRYGLPFLVPMLGKRKVFICSLILTVAFWICSSFFIWNIEVEGNFKITDDNFNWFFQENNIRMGMCKKELDIEQLEKSIRRSFPCITWTSAKLSGTKLIISVKENDVPYMGEEEQMEEYSDLIAEFDGKIVSMIVRNGLPKVKIGDEVKKGDVLVEGSIPIFNDDLSIKNYQYVEADADLIVEHRRNYIEKIPFDYINKEYTGEVEKFSYIRIGEKEFLFPMNSRFLCYDIVIRESQPVVFQKLSIPIFYGVTTYREYQNVEHEYTLKQAEEILLEKCNIFLKTLNEKGVQILEKNVKIDTKDGMWIIKGDFVVREFIGVSVPISKSDVGEVNIDE